MSRYLHIEHGVSIKKFSTRKLIGVGNSLDEFNRNLRHTIRDFGIFLEDVKNREGDGTMAGLIEALIFRLEFFDQDFNFCIQFPTDISIFQ